MLRSQTLHVLQQKQLWFFQLDVAQDLEYHRATILLVVDTTMKALDTKWLTWEACREDIHLGCLCQEIGVPNIVKVLLVFPQAVAELCGCLVTVTGKFGRHVQRQDLRRKELSTQPAASGPES